MGRIIVIVQRLVHHSFRMKFNKQNKFFPYFSLGLLIILGYWQISFFAAAFKWDMVDVVFPFRHYFSECIHSGFFPFWNPFQQTGTPFYADLQAPTYYPELLYTSFLGGYSIYTMHLLFIGYLFISAMGMYQLSLFFNKSKKASFVAALAYIFSGYIVAHAQHFFLLVGMAWIPFVILSYIKLNQKLNLISTIKTSLFVFLMVTGAYQALSITLMYLLLLFFAYFIIKSIAENNRTRILRILKFNLIFAIMVVLLSLPLIVSTLEVLHSVTRLVSGIDLHITLNNRLPLTTLFSLIVPFSTITKTDFFNHADVSLINYYFGIVMLLFFFISLFKKHTFLEYIILFFGIIVFSMNFDFLPVVKWMWEYVPLMNSFKSASYLSIFGILAFILMAANYFAVFEKNVSSERKKIIISSFIFLAIFIYLIVLSLHKLMPHNPLQRLNVSSFSNIFTHATFYQSVFIQSAFDSIIISGIILTLIFYKKIKQPVAIIIILLIGDFLFAAQLNMNTTAVDVRYKPKDLQTSINLSPGGFPIPVNDKIIFNDQLHAFFAPFWRNTYIFTKQISFTGFSSFKLNSYNKIDHYQNLKNATLNNHLFYFSDTVIPLSEFSDKSININDSKYLFVPERDFKILSRKSVKTDPSDIIQIQKFTPNEVVIATRTKNDQFLTMLQTNYKGWKSYIDNKPTHIYTSNFNYRTLFLPKGKHTVSYKYKNKMIIWLYIASNIFFISLVLILLGRRLFNEDDKSKKHLFVPAIIISLIIILAFLNFTHKNQNISTLQYYTSFFGKKDKYFSVEKYFEKGNNQHGALNADSCKKCAFVDPGTEFLPIVEIVQKNNKIKEGTLFIRARIFTRNYPNALIVSEIKKKWHAGKIEKQIERTNHWNNLFYVRHIPKMNEGDVLKVYIWNQHKSKFIVKDVSVGFYR